MTLQGRGSQRLQPGGIHRTQATNDGLVERAYSGGSYRKPVGVSYQGKPGQKGRSDTLISANCRKAASSNRQQPAKSSP